MAESSKRAKSTDYSIRQESETKPIAAPELEFTVPVPKFPYPAVGLAGCGGIAPTHLQVYREQGIPVVALFDRHPERAEKLRDQFFPQAKVCHGEDEFLDQDFQIADLTMHPQDRAGLIERALKCQRHILSQKPLALDIQLVDRMIEIAAAEKVHLAVNHNGRWAPHVAYARGCVEKHVLGEMESADVSIYWDHNWCAGTPFDKVPHLLLYDFAIHWFDMVCCYLQPFRPKTVYSQLARTSSQRARPALTGQVVVEFSNPEHDQGKRRQASLVFRGDSKLCPSDRTILSGSRGVLVCSGPNLNEQTVELHTCQGVAQPALKGQWFNDGFRGTINELICAIQQDRMPAHAAMTVRETLLLCFAAVASAESGQAVRVGDVTKMPAARDHR